MTMAIQQAKLAERAGEIPVGAVVVIDGIIVGTGYNLNISRNDRSAHAEMLAIREAAINIENYRLVDATLYVTLEPCAMCAGLLVHSRIKQLVFGAYDNKAGASGSVFCITQAPALNHQIPFEGGVLEQECSALLSNFFKARREQQRLKKDFLRNT